MVERPSESDPFARGTRGGTKRPATASVELARLRRLLAGDQRQESGTGIVQLDPEKSYFSGTTAPVVAPRWAARASGLIVPASLASTSPIDLMQPYATLHDVVGFSLSLEGV